MISCWLKFRRHRWEVLFADLNYPHYIEWCSICGVNRRKQKHVNRLCVGCKQ